MVSCSKYILVLAVLLFGFMSRDSSAALLRPYPSLQFQDKTRQEVIRLADRIIRLTMLGSHPETTKRNGGALDYLYNLPDLSDNGRR